MTIANVFVDSQDDVRLNLRLMYKTIIIIVRRPIIIGLSNCPAISPQCRTSHPAQMRNKVYFGRPRTVLITSYSSSRGLADSRVRVQAIFWDSASQVGGPAHVSSSSVRTLQRLSILWMLRGRGCARDGTERNAESIPGTIGFSSSLEMF